MKELNQQQRSQSLRQQLNEQTARIAWTDLQIHFARGVVIRVARELDLVEVAAQIAEDSSQQVAEWNISGRLAIVTDQQAQQWLEQQAELWAVVVKPLVLVQVIEN